MNIGELLDCRDRNDIKNTKQSYHITNEHY